MPHWQLYHFQIRFSTVLMEVVLLQLEIEFSSLGNKDNGICPINIAHLAKKPGERGYSLWNNQLAQMCLFSTKSPERMSTDKNLIYFRSLYLMRLETEKLC